MTESSPLPMRADAPADRGRVVVADDLVPSVGTRAKIVTGMPVLYTLSRHDAERINAGIDDHRGGPWKPGTWPPRYYTVGESFPGMVLRHLDGSLCLVVNLYPWPPYDDGDPTLGYSYTRRYPGEDLGDVMLMPRLLVFRHGRD